MDGRITCIDSPRALKLHHGERTVRVEYLADEVVAIGDFPLDGLGDDSAFLRLLREHDVQTIHTPGGESSRRVHSRDRARSRMTRLAATVGVDLRVQLRNGFYLATGLAVIFSIALLRWPPQSAAMLLLPVVILENVLMNAFYFVSGLVLLERTEGTFVAQSVTPLRAGRVSRVEAHHADRAISGTWTSIACRWQMWTGCLR